MKPFTVHTGTAVPLRRSDVDTDQIIPAVWLKRVERTGFGDGPVQRLAQGPVLRAERRPLRGRHRPARRARTSAPAPPASTPSGRCTDYGFQAVLSPRFADIFRGNSFKNGFLPVQLPEAVVERADGGRRGRPGHRGHRRSREACEVRWGGHHRATSTSTTSSATGCSTVSTTSRSRSQPTPTSRRSRRSGPRSCRRRCERRRRADRRDRAPGVGRLELREPADAARRLGPPDARPSAAPRRRDGARTRLRRRPGHRGAARRRSARSGHRARRVCSDGGAHARSGAAVRTAPPVAG